LHCAAERRWGTTTDDDRRRGTLHRLRLRLHIGKGDIVALIRWLRLCPDSTYGRQIVVPWTAVSCQEFLVCVRALGTPHVRCP
jgi:hypothetical protein